jgi:hypothetical protein
MKLLYLLILIGGIAVFPNVHAGEKPASPEQATKDWADVLERHVDDRGYVDFKALKQNPTALIRYTDWVAAVDPAKHPEWFPDTQSKLAHHINAYNALAMKHVLDNDLPKELTALRRLNFFRLSKIGVGDTRMSLEAYENNIIRKIGEPRVHVALNCMSESCPRLPRVPFAAATLDAQLDQEARKFFNESRNVRVDMAKRTVYLTEIMKFFPEDFLAVSPSLIAYANRYRNDPIPTDYQVRHIPYDWTIIQQR